MAPHRPIKRKPDINTEEGAAPKSGFFRARKCYRPSSGCGCSCLDARLFFSGYGEKTNSRRCHWPLLCCTVGGRYSTPICLHGGGKGEKGRHHLWAIWTGGVCGRKCSPDVKFRPKECWFKVWEGGFLPLAAYPLFPDEGEFESMGS
ncbi:hypothetical protein TNCV_3744641 [Trichonephila clavipes]|nr:hypothetical protein TNCV_3744641 [Trichonephila clavipes]